MPQLYDTVTDTYAPNWVEPDELSAEMDRINAMNFVIEVEIALPTTGPLTTYQGVTLVAPAILSLIACVAATGVNLFPYVVSSYRSYAQQVALWNAYQNGTGNLAAQPGTSDHESGTAIDLSASFQYAHPSVRAWLLSHGWAADVPSEYWHLH